MARVHIVLADGDGPLIDAETVTSGPDNQTCSITVPASPPGDYRWLVTVTGGDVRCVSGATPDAAQARHWLVLDGSQSVSIPAAAGDTLAYMDQPLTPLDSLMEALRGAGILDRLDFLYVTDAVSEATSRKNRVGPAYTALVSGGVTWEPGQGFQGDGTTGYIDTGFNPATAGGWFSQNSGHIGFYSVTENSEASVEMGAYIAPTGTHLSATYGMGQILSRNNAVNAAFNGTGIRSVGHFVASRTNHSSYTVYKDGSPVAVVTEASAAPPSGNLLVGAYNENGVPALRSTKRFAAVHAGAGLSDIQTAVFADAIRDYLAGIVSGWDVFLIAGQSNTQYGYGWDLAYDVADPRVWQMQLDGRPGVATTPLDHFSRSMNDGRIGFGFHFAKSHYADAKLASGRRVLLVPCGANGTSFANGDWTNGTGTYWTQAVARANAAMALPGAEFKGILWHQGESDALTGGAAVTNYATNLDAALNGFRSAITGASGCPIVVGGLAYDFYNGHSDRQDVQDDIVDTPNRISNCGYASSTSPTVLGTDDGTHFTAAYQRTLAGRFYDAWGTLA